MVFKAFARNCGQRPGTLFIILKVFVIKISSSWEMTPKTSINRIVEHSSMTFLST